MSYSDFRDPATPQEIIQARLANPPRRRAAPLAAWFMLTAVMAGHCAVLGTALAGQEWDEGLANLLIAMALGSGVSASLGGVSGLFDQTPLRGGGLGAAMGAVVGMTAVAATAIPGDKINLAFHASALAALCILAVALMGRWRR